MKKTLFMKGVMIAICSAMLLLLNYVMFKVYVNRQIHLVSTYIAARDIHPREKIKESDVIEVKVPYAYLLDYTYNDKRDIVGKYTDIQGMIPAGSPFYDSMLMEENLLPDQPITQCKTGQTAYALQTDMTRLGSITAGMRVDIHVTIARRDAPPVTGALCEHVRVISVKDHKGISVDSPNSTGVPYLIELAVNREDIELLTMAESEGTIRLFASLAPYDDGTEAVRTDSEAVRYLAGDIVNPNEDHGNVEEIIEAVLPIEPMEPQIEENDVDTQPTEMENPEE